MFFPTKITLSSALVAELEFVEKIAKLALFYE